MLAYTIVVLYIYKIGHSYASAAGKRKKPFASNPGFHMEANSETM
jgi:hypothetical protein